MEITITPRSYCFVVFNAPQPPSNCHEDPKLNGLEGSSRVALRRAIVRKLKELYAVQIMKSASLFIAPLSSMGKIQELCSWITSSELNEAHCFEGDFVPPDQELFEAILDDTEAILFKVSKQKQNQKGKAQLLRQLTLLDHFAALLTSDQRSTFMELQTSYKELLHIENDLVLQAGAQ